MIKRLIAVDFDGCLIDSPEPEVGKKIWKLIKGYDYEYKGWWGRPESLDLDVFNIKPFPEVLKILKKEMMHEDTHVIILTSRVEKLRSKLQAVLDYNDIKVDKLDMKRNEKTKGEKILDYIDYFEDLEEISVYDDRDSDIESYKSIVDKIPKNIVFNIYQADKGKLTLLPTNKKSLSSILNEEIQKMLNEEYIYHGTYIGAAYHIQRDGKMRINAAGNNEPYISFTSNPNVANYYANMKGGSERSVILRTKLNNNFTLSPKFEDNKGHEWITDSEIPINYLEVKTKEGWMPLSDYNFIK